MIRTCLCLITRAAPSGNNAELLLGYKKTGFGAGRWVGIGGHIEEGEERPPRRCARSRRNRRWSSRDYTLSHMATLTFLFPAGPAWDQTAEVFLTRSSPAAPPSPTSEPRWFDGELPFDGMWDDAKYWLPIVLAGDRVVVTITFADDCATVDAIEPALGARPPVPQPRSSLDKPRIWINEAG